MKRLLLALNIILVIAIGVLYYLYFSYTRSDIHKVIENQKAANTPFRIAYFDLDSLQEHYIYYKEVRDYLRNHDSEMTQQLNVLRKSFYDKAKEYNQKGPSMSQTEQSEYQDLLNKMQTNFQQRQEQASQEMSNLSMQKLQQVKSNIQSFLKEYCKDKGYAYVFAASSNDDYLYYKDSLRDITPDIIGLLNERYQKSKKP